MNANPAGGSQPDSRLILDAGNLYGLAEYGGAYSAGALFELSSTGGGGWTESAAFSFDTPFSYEPTGPLALDGAGNLYGTTLSGGRGQACQSERICYGTVFKLTSRSGGGFTASFLHAFTDQGADGYDPHGGVVRDASGNLYGTTVAGGTGVCQSSGGPAVGCGTVFELSPVEGGSYAFKVLHNFQGAVLGAPGRDGQAPYGNLVLDAEGNLYGTTTSSGAYNGGTVFELSPRAGGGWAEKILHYFDFAARDGFAPQAGLIFDAAGNLYGTTENGGTGHCVTYGERQITGCGTVFKLSPSSGSGRTETVLYSFQTNGSDGWYPMGNLTFDNEGNLYGTTNAGGAGSCTNVDGAFLGCGIVFELSPSSGGAWTETVLHEFQNNSVDGMNPTGDVILDSSGNVYGTTFGGGNAGKTGGGTVFEITP